MNGAKKAWLAALWLGAAAVAAEFAPEEFVTLSGPLCPEVRMAARRGGDGALTLRLTAENPYAAVKIKVGAHAGKAAFKEAEKFPATLTFTPAETGGGAPLRLALEAEWRDASGLRQREVFRAPAVGDRLPASPADWEPFDYDAYCRALADRRDEIHFEVTQPLSGKLSVVVEDPQGRRVRNLVSGEEWPAGKHRLTWDGKDEFGNFVAPGDYAFRAVSHPGIVPHFQMQFANGGERIFSPFGSNHAVMTALAASPEYVFAAAPLTEGGNAIIAMGHDGALRHAYQCLNGASVDAVAIATDGKRLFVVNDGNAWWGRDHPAMTLSVFNVENSEPLSRLDGRPQALVVRAREKRAAPPGTKRPAALAGAAFLAGRLYVADRERQEILVVAPDDGRVEKTLPLKDPGPLATAGDALYATSGREVVALEPASGKARKLFALPFAPRGLCATAKAFFVSGAPDHAVKAYAPTGKPLKSYGAPGGNYAGRWDPRRLVAPAGVAATAAGKLWVAEDRWNPKRLSRWDVATGEFEYDKVGCPAYGSPGGGIDPADGERWLGHRCVWKIDFDRRAAQIVAVMQQKQGHLGGRIPECFGYRFHRQGGRTFVIGNGKAATVSELMPDGRLRDLALLSTVHQLFYAMNWARGTAFNEEVEKRFACAKPEENYGDPRLRSVGVAWVDADGDGDGDAGEFQFFPLGTIASEFGGWGLRADGLTFRIPYRDPKGGWNLLTLAPDGFNAAGAPRYDVAKALATAKPLAGELPAGVRELGGAVANDGQGRCVVASDPYMVGLAKDGRVEWAYANRWSNVHGSHDAPLPSVGEMQGVLFALGVAPLDQEGDVMAWLGNHGRVFVLTTDGIYLDEMFSDCRVAEVTGPGLIGGEAFGGNFEYDRKHRRYLLNAGSSGYRIYALSGLDKVTRSRGRFTVTDAMLQAAARRAEAAAAAARPAPASVPRVPAGTADIDSLPPAAQWASPAGAIQARAAHDGKHLLLQYNVPDASPWVNGGKDWTRLFKTGDCVDFQIGLDAAPGRADAAPGDLRLSVAPFGDGAAAVLYRHRLGAGQKGNAVDFASPWRSERVEDVRKLDAAEVKVERFDGWYRARVRVPLAALGLAAAPGKTLRGDFGVVFGDREGTVNLSRVYWSNKSTGLVNDVPGEIILPVKHWGPIKFGE